MKSESITRQLLVRGGGRCPFCNTDLLNSGFTQLPINLGERAHIVGRSQNPKSPRGDYDLDVNLRDDFDNLLMVCRSCHGEIDAPPNVENYPVNLLRKIKQWHESRIFQILSIPPDRDSAVLRMHGTIGTSNVAIDRTAAAAAVLANGRCAFFSLSHDPSGIEIDLRKQLSPVIGNCEYYKGCREIIKQEFERRIEPAVNDRSIRHLSVFALARWPLLVYLGACLGDKLEVDIYQRHRATDSWAWPDDPTDSGFSLDIVNERESAQDVVLVLSISAVVHLQEVPKVLEGCPIYKVTPAGNQSPHADIIDSPTALKFAELALRDVFADIEEHRKEACRLHVLGAAPLSVFVALGRVANPEIHPPMILYDRVKGQYQPVLEVN